MLHRGRHWSNIHFRMALVGVPAYLLVVAVGASQIPRSPAWTQVNVPVTQPLPFSHAHHAGLLNMDCRYCHTTVEDASVAGIPSTSLCMTCHAQIWTGLGAVQTLKASHRTAIPIEWIRVHDLPDFAHFDHSIHVRKGFGCVTCHGRVDQMARIWQTETLNMKWCLECHREPERYVQPQFTVADLGWQPPENRADVARLARKLDLSPLPEDYRDLQHQLVEKYGIRRQTSCSNCHP